MVLMYYLKELDSFPSSMGDGGRLRSVPRLDGIGLDDLVGHRRGKCWSPLRAGQSHCRDRALI